MYTTLLHLYGTLWAYLQCQLPQGMKEVVYQVSSKYSNIDRSSSWHLCHALCVITHTHARRLHEWLRARKFKRLFIHKHAYWITYVFVWPCVQLRVCVFEENWLQLKSNVKKSRTLTVWVNEVRVRREWWWIMNVKWFVINVIYGLCNLAVNMKWEIYKL